MMSIIKILTKDWENLNKKLCNTISEQANTLSNISLKLYIKHYIYLYSCIKKNYNKLRVTSVLQAICKAQETTHTLMSKQFVFFE